MDDNQQIGDSLEAGITYKQTLSNRFHHILQPVWLALVGISLLWFVVNVPAFYRQVASVPDAPGWYAAVTAGLDVLFVGLCAFVGILIFRHRSNDSIAWLTSLVLILWGINNGLIIQTKDALLGELAPGTVYYAIEAITFLGYLGWMLFFYIFPSGTFVPGWTRWAAAAWLLFSGTWYLWPEASFSPPQWPGWLFGPVVLSLWGSFLVSQFLRYRRVSSPTERLQTKWVLYGIAIAVLIAPPVWVFVGSVFETPLGEWPRHLFVQTVGILGISAIPVTIGLAALRRHLFDIDVLINRTLVYGSLTAATVGIYILMVVGAGSVLENQANAIVAFIATGIVAVIFQPLRNRLQSSVDRLMYGQRDDPVEMLTQLAQRLETVDAPESILPTLVETIATSLKLPYVALWLLKSDGDWEPAAVFGRQTDDEHMLPLLHQGKEVGRLFVAPRGPGERFSRQDERLLGMISQLSATTVRAAQLSVELQQSRREIISGIEEERRRLRRDLHDGLGPALASVALRADTARDLTESDPAATQQLLEEIMLEAQNAVADIRRLVYGLRPPALDELGLVKALRQSTQAYPTRVNIDAPQPLPPLPAAVEVAAYRIVQEAVNNASQHGRAGNCTVTLLADQELHLKISDDGVGLAPDAASGVGLVSMRERAAELGGTFTIQAAPSGGVQIQVRIPIE